MFKQHHTSDILVLKKNLVSVLILFYSNIFSYSFNFSFQIISVFILVFISVSNYF
jgi:hypothetical protein